MATCSTGLYCIGQRSQVYGSLLEELLEGHGYAVDNEYFVSSTDGWSEDHAGVRRHAAGMSPNLKGGWKEHLLLVEFA